MGSALPSAHLQKKILPSRLAQCCNVTTAHRAGATQYFTVKSSRNFHVWPTLQELRQSHQHIESHNFPHFHFCSCTCRAYAVQWEYGCPSFAPCCSEYGFCRPLVRRMMYMYIEWCMVRPSFSSKLLRAGLRIGKTNH